MKTKKWSLANPNAPGRGRGAWALASIAAALCSFAATGAASPPGIEIDSVHLAEDQEAAVAVRAVPPDGIVAAVFTIHYDTSAVELAAFETPLFPDFATQFAEVGGEPWFGDSFTAPDGTQRTHPVELAVEPGLGARVAALRLIPADGVEDRLIVLRLQLAEGATPGFFPVSVEPTVLTSAAAGYPSEGLAVDPLLTLTMAPPEDSAYSPLLTAAELPGAADPGLVVFAAAFSDTSGSGLDDAWEIRYFGTTGLTDAFEDFDGDGLTNLLEKFHGGNPTVPGSVPRQTAGVEDGRLVLRFPLAPTLLGHTVETTADPGGSWTPVPTEETGFTIRPDLGQTPDWTMVELSVPLPPGNRSFFRLRVTTP